jgi:mRNA interferase MazF
MVSGGRASARGLRYVPERGDVVWISFSPQTGHEQAGRRPGVVLSPRVYNGRAGLGLICPVTSQVKGYPFEVRIPPGLPVAGVILSDQVRNLDWQARQTEFLCTLPEGTVIEVLETLYTLLS